MNSDQFMHAADLLSTRAGLTPDRTALLELESGISYSFSSLNARANRCANWLKATFGIEKGDRVSILAKNSVVYLDLFYGLAKIGAIFAPFNWRLTANELTYMVNDCSPKVLFVGDDFLNLVEKIQEKATIPNLVFIDQTKREGDLFYEEQVIKASDAEPMRPSLDSETPYCIFYTSGTTGKPKGAVLPHRQILFNCINTVASWGLTEKDISPVYTPMFHVGGLFAFLTPIFYIGGKIILSRDFDPETSLRWILEEKCTVILGVPTLFQMWMESEYFEMANFEHVRFFISGGAPCPPQMMQSWRDRKEIIFRQGYGLTEAGPNCFSMTDEDSEFKSGSVGKPMMHTKMKLVNPETGEQVPDGEHGELWIYGPHVCSGYWNKPEATAEVLEEGWIKTGDMVYKDSDNYYTIVGRYKDMIKSGGENVYAAEVEAAFRQHASIKDCALIGKPDDKWGEVGFLVIVPEVDKHVQVEELGGFVKNKIAKFKVPKEFVVADSLPYTAYGKVEKSKLRKLYL